MLFRHPGLKLPDDGYRPVAYTLSVRGAAKLHDQSTSDERTGDHGVMHAQLHLVLSCGVDYRAERTRALTEYAMTNVRAWFKTI